MVAAPGERRIGTLATESARQRFNVAVSRAQDQLWLYHTATLDVLSDACMRHRLLSYMLDPARQTTEESDQTFDSEFERAVFRRITERGFHVRTQVCVGDPTNHRYRIDLVVEGMQGRLAVECDGDKWHGPERYEHDDARQRDLQRAGWQFERIGGGEFYRDPVKAMEPVWTELDRLGIKPGGIDEDAAEPPAPAPLERGEATLVVSDVSEPPSASAEPESVVPSSGATGVPGTRQPAPIATVPESRTTPEEEPQQSRRPPDSEPFPEPLSVASTTGVRAPYSSFEGKSAPDPRHADRAQVADGLCRIIDVEGPMLAKRSYDIYLRGCGIRRMGRELKRTMNKALQHAIQNGRVVKEDESDRGGLVYTIVRLKGTPPVLVRERGPRKFEEIPPSELQYVARRLADKGNHEAGSDTHLRAVLEFYDLKRLTVQVGTMLLESLDHRYPYVEEVIRGTSAPKPNSPRSD